MFLYLFCLYCLYLGKLRRKEQLEFESLAKYRPSTEAPSSSSNSLSLGNSTTNLNKPITVPVSLYDNAATRNVTYTKKTYTNTYATQSNHAGNSKNKSTSSNNAATTSRTPLTTTLHPSWEAAKKNKESKKGFIHIDVSNHNSSAKKIKFDD